MTVDSFRHALELDINEVLLLSRSEREYRVYRLIERSCELFELAEANYLGSRELVASAVLFSGGNDSTILLHLARELGKVTHTVHANTGIGIEATRQFVRKVSAEWGIPLIEEHPPAGCTYRELVLEYGFPGPAHHWKMYQRLKERCLDQARIPLGVHRSHKRRAFYVAGRRREESKRRVDVPLYEPDGSVIWVSPLAEWTKMDLNTYRLMHDVPLNEVTSLIHMSGECLCGSFAKPGELEEVGDWFPLVRTEIEELEQLLIDREDIPAERRRWGWGAYKDHAAGMPTRHPPKTGRLCNSCSSGLEGV